MKKLGFALSLALLVGALVSTLFTATSFAQSGAGGRASGFGRPVKVYWEGGSLTTDLTDETDSTRTLNISTRDWDWGTLNSGTATGTAVINIAKIVFEANTTNWAGDSIYFAIEPSTDGGTTFAPYQGLIGQLSNNWTATRGNCALLVPYQQSTPAQWVGYLVYDRDGEANSSGVTPNNNLFGVNDFRLKVYGDVAGTSPTYTGMTCTIYPLKIY